MKKLILTCVMISSVSAVSFAQNPKPAGAPPPQPVNSAAVHKGEPSVTQMAESRAKMIKDQYKLNEDQYKKIVKIESDFFTQEREIRNSGKPPQRGQIMEMVVKKDEKYKTVLTPEQFAKYDATRPKMPPPPPAPPAGAQAPAPGNQPAH